MILADTSVWVDHFRLGDAELMRLLERNLITVHPFIVGELACGHLAQRSQVLGLLRNLPMAPEATQDEVHFLIEQHQLMGRGIGWIDAHLLASTRLGGSLRLWTHDKRLNAVASELDLGR